MTPAALTTRFGRTATPTWLQQSSPKFAATLTHGRKPAMPPARYALLPKIDNITKPKAFGSLALLCAAIERERADQGLHLVEVEDIEFRDIGGLHRGVQVWTLDLGNEKDRMLGYAWLDGAGREVLEPALRQARIQKQAASMPRDGLVREEGGFRRRYNAHEIGLIAQGRESEAKSLQIARTQ